MKINIKKIAAQKGYTLYRLAQITMLPQQTIYSWATGKTQPNYKNMDLLCTVLDCGIADLYEAEKVDAVEVYEAIILRKEQFLIKEARKLERAKARLYKGEENERQNT